MSNPQITRLQQRPEGIYMERPIYDSGTNSYICPYFFPSVKNSRT